MSLLVISLYAAPDGTTLPPTPLTTHPTMFPKLQHFEIVLLVLNIHKIFWGRRLKGQIAATIFSTRDRGGIAAGTIK